MGWNGTMSQAAAEWRIGPIGFAYDDWAGSFYPAGLPKAARLEYAASRFDCIEMDTTFYALPSPVQARAWGRQAPETCEFIFKAPQALTHSPHPGRLASAEGAALWREFVQTAAEAGVERTSLLVQLPPSFSPARLGELEALAGLPTLGMAVFYEFRQAGWHRGPAQALGQPVAAADLAGYGEAALVPSPQDEHPYPLVDNGGPIYLRLCGRHGQYEMDSQELFDSTPRLAWWMARIRSAVRPGRKVIATVGNSYSGHAPAVLDRLSRLIGREPKAGIQPALDL